MSITIRKAFKILDKYQRLGLSVLLLLIIGSALFEADFLLYMRRIITRVVCGEGVNESLLFLTLLYIFKELLYFLNICTINEFIANYKTATQRKIIDTYMHCEYEYFISKKIIDIVYMVSRDIDNGYRVLKNVIRLLMELLIVFNILVILAYINIALFMVLISVIIISVILTREVVTPLRKRSVKREELVRKEYLRWLVQCIIGMKEIKINEREEYFADALADQGDKSVEASRKRECHDEIEDLIDVISVAIIAVAASIMIYLRFNFNAVIIELAVFFVALTKLRKSISKIRGCAKYIRESKLDFEKLAQNINEVYELRKHHKKREETLQIEYSFEKNIIAKAVTCLGNEKVILNSASIIIPAKATVAITGAFGEGKTSIMDAILGLLQISDGIIACDGVKVEGDFHSIRMKVGYVPQMVFVIDGTVRDNIMFSYGEEEDDEVLWKVLELAQLADFVFELPDRLNTRIGGNHTQLNSVQRQKLGIARVLYRNPDIIIFDECMKVMDEEIENAVMDSVMNIKGETTVIIITKRLTRQHECDMIYRMKRGKVYLEREQE